MVRPLLYLRASVMREIESVSSLTVLRFCVVVIHPVTTCEWQVDNIHRWRATAANVITACDAWRPTRFMWVVSPTTVRDEINPSALRRFVTTKRSRKSIVMLTSVSETIRKASLAEAQTALGKQASSSSAVAKRPRDASCLSVSFNSTKRRVESFIVS